MRLIVRLALCLLTVLPPGLSARAQSAMPDLSEVADVRLIPGWIEPDGSRMAALQVTMAPGWKTYFRNGGFSGIPPRFDWTGSSNLADVSYLWPRPHVIVWKGVLAVGYKDRLVLPIRFRPREAAQPLTIAGSVELGVCREVCIPFEVPLAMDDPAAGEEGTATLIRAALAERARPGAELGLRVVRCDLTPNADGARLVVTMSSPPALEPPEQVVIELSDPEIWVSEPRSTLGDSELVAETQLVAYGSDLSNMDLSDVIITVLMSETAAELTGCP